MRDKRDRQKKRFIEALTLKGTVYHAAKAAGVSSCDSFGNTPLSTAVFNYKGNGDLITLLRDRNADPYRENHHGQSPVGLARLIANYDVGKYFDDLPK